MKKNKNKEIIKYVNKTYWEFLLKESQTNNLTNYDIFIICQKIPKNIRKIVKNIALDKYKFKVKKEEISIAKKQKKFQNVLSNHLVKDYIKNKKDIVAIYSDHINFGTRNHWAKCPKDLKILQILKKWKEKN